MSSRAAPPTVLIVDDDDAIANLVSKIVSRAGFLVLTARGGLEGIALAREQKPSVILCDYGLPDCSGGSVLAAVRDNPETRNIQFIMSSGDMGLNVEGEQPNAYLFKPFHMADVITLLKRLTRSY